MNASHAIVPSRDRARELLPAPRSTAEHDRLDLSETLNFFARYWQLIAGIAALTMLLGLGLSLVLPKTYRAQATVMIDKGAASTDDTQPTPASRTVVSNELVETQVQIITSREMTQRVLGALGLFEGRTADERRELEDAARENVSAARSGESYAIQILYDADDAAAAARMANEYAAQFANWELSEDRTHNFESRQIVAQRLADLRQQAQADTQALQQYRIANNLLSTSGASLTEQEISNYEQEVARARASAAEEQARLRTALTQVRSGSTGDDVGEALGSSVITSLREQETTAAAQVADLAARYGPNHPELIRARSKLAEIRGSIQSEIGRVMSNLEARQDVAEQRLSSLSGSLGTAKAKLSQNNAAMVGLSDLERKAAASQGIYETYLNSYRQLLAAEGTERPGAKILTRATPPTRPVSPNLKLNLLLALVAGLGFGILAAYVAGALAQGITRSDEIESELGERFLASVPLLGTGRGRGTDPHAIAAIRDEPRSVFAESFRALSASLDQYTASTDAVIAVTSALPGEGKTIVSCCLAHTSAARGLRTVLIDCDLRRRGISKLLGVKADQVGLMEVLSGTAPLDVKGMSEDYTFCIIPISPSEEEPEALLTGDAFDELIAQLRERFERIILDLPPVLPIAATRKLAQTADAVVFAVNWQKTPKAAIKAALARLPHDLVNVVGVVLNKVDMRRRAQFGHHDPGYYYSRYKEYYS